MHVAAFLFYARRTTGVVFRVKGCIPMAAHKFAVELSVVIPVYNEQVRIGDSLTQVLRYLDTFPLSYEILIVDDGSTDLTMKVVAETCQGRSEIRTLHYKQNRGKGYAVRCGMMEGKGRYRLFCDADLSTPIEELERLVFLLDQGYDLCIASRAVPESQVTVHQPIYRELMGKIYNRIVRLMLALPFSDTQCGFKCLKGDVADTVFPLLQVDRFGFDVELLYVARHLGYSIKEVGTKWRNSPATKVGLIIDPIKMVATIPKIYMYFFSGHYRRPPASPRNP